VIKKQSVYQHIFQLLKNRFFWSIFFLLLIHVSGAIGMVFYDKEIFASMTPYNLMLMFVILLGNEKNISTNFIISLILGSVAGFFAEFLGINYGILFGEYTYGDILGIKWFGVPLLISLNWFSIVYCSFVASGQLLKSANKKSTSFFFLQALCTAVLTTSFDWLMEPVAVQLNFWSWENGDIPFFNYLCWFAVSFLISLGFSSLKISVFNPFSKWLLAVQAAFFLFLRIFLS
jgi:putative membrane protein